MAVKIIMKIIKIDCQKIVDWKTFHEVFNDEMGFPDFYGKNMDAWIDCMTSLDEPEDGMTKVHVEKGQVLTLQLDNVKEFMEKCPEQYAGIIECSAFVNRRRIEEGSDSVLTLSF
jgi:RNAse (barnase) inhibitor barstar